MTLIASLEGKDGMVLASDSRGTIGDPRGLTAINDVHKKIFKLCSHCGIAIAGSSELANQFIDLLNKRIQENKISDVDHVVNEISTWGKKQYEEWFGSRPWVSTAQQGNIIDQRPSMIFIVSGYNSNTDKKSRIYLLNNGLDFTPQLCTTGHMLAGVPQYATYLIHRLYNPEMKLENIKSLTAYLVTETATQDPKVGGPLRMAKITLKDGYAELPNAEIDAILKKNEEQNIKLREFFFKEQGK